MPFELAALAEPLACVLHGRELCALHPRRRVLVLGAGPLGLLWTGTLSADGHHVALADPNPGRLEIGRRFGASSAIEVERGSAATTLFDFDVAIDCTASASGFETGLRALNGGGVLCVFAGPGADTETSVNLHELHYGEQRIVGAYHYRPQNYAAALELIAGGRLPVEALISAFYRGTWEDALRRYGAPSARSPVPALSVYRDRGTRWRDSSACIDDAHVGRDRTPRAAVRRAFARGSRHESAPRLLTASCEGLNVRFMQLQHPRLGRRCDALDPRSSPRRWSTARLGLSTRLLPVRVDREKASPDFRGNLRE